MHDNDRLCFGRNAALHVRGIEIISVGSQIGKDGHPLLENDTDDRADVGDRRRNHFVARRNPCRRHGDVQRRRAGRAWHDVFHGADLLETLAQKGRLRSFPVKERVLPEHRVQALTLRIAPTDRQLRGPFDRLLAAVPGEFRQRIGVIVSGAGQRAGKQRT